MASKIEKDREREVTFSVVRRLKRGCVGDDDVDDDNLFSQPNLFSFSNSSRISAQHLKILHILASSSCFCFRQKQYNFLTRDETLKFNWN